MSQDIVMLPLKILVGRSLHRTADTYGYRIQNSVEPPKITARLFIQALHVSASLGITHKSEPTDFFGYALSCFMTTANTYHIRTMLRECMCNLSPNSLTRSYHDENSVFHLE